MIHDSDPFATPESARSAARRLRGRFVQSVTLWTAPGPAGLTVSSCLVSDGDPGRLLGLIDDESQLWTAVQRSGVFAVALLSLADKQIADRFAGLLPAPGGLFRQGERWVETEFGPVLPSARTWVGCRLDTGRPFGWGQLVEATIAEISFGDDSTPLLHNRGSYRELSSS